MTRRPPGAPAGVCHPALRGGLPTRVGGLAFGLFVFAAGIVALLEARLGLSPWDVLHQGLARHSPLTFGEANIAVGLVVLAAAWLLGARLGLGTVLNATLIGAFIQLFTSIDGVADLAHSGLPERIVLLGAGLCLVGVGSAFYIGAAMGAGPRDSLMLALAARTGLRIGVVRVALELSALAAGLVLGGTAGVGTVAFALLIGPLVEVGFFLLAHSPLAAEAPLPAAAEATELGAL